MLCQVHTYNSSQMHTIYYLPNLICISKTITTTDNWTFNRCTHFHTELELRRGEKSGADLLPLALVKLYPGNVCFHTLSLGEGWVGSWHNSRWNNSNFTKGKSPRDEMKNNGESSKCTYRSCVYKLAWMQIASASVHCLTLDTNMSVEIP